MYNEMKKEIKVTCKYPSFNPDAHSLNLEVETREYTGKITHKSIMVDIGEKKLVRIPIQILVEEGKWWSNSKGICNGGIFSLSNKEDMKCLKKLYRIIKKINNLEKDFTK